MGHPLWRINGVKIQRGWSRGIPLLAKDARNGAPPSDLIGCAGRTLLCSESLGDGAVESHFSQSAREMGHPSPGLGAKSKGDVKGSGRRACSPWAVVGVELRSYGQPRAAVPT